MDLFARPSEVTPLGLLYDVALRQLFALAAGELDQNFAPALWAVAHWMDKWIKTPISGYTLFMLINPYLFLGHFRL